MYEDVKYVYTDGGVIGPNPSATGGTFAWRWVTAEGEVVGEGSGLLLPEALDLDRVSNNVTELFAIADALDLLPDGWSGTVCSDSGIALGWAFKGWNQAKAHRESCVRIARALARFGEVKWVLLGGHPSKEDLAAGMRKDGYPVSQHNVWCDKECTRISREHVKAHPAYAEPGASAALVP